MLFLLIYHRMNCWWLMFLMTKSQKQKTKFLCFDIFWYISRREETKATIMCQVIILMCAKLLGLNDIRNVLMPLGWGEGTGFFLSRVACHEWKEKIIPKRVTKAHLDSPRVTSGVATSDEWGIQMGLEWRVWELFLWLLLSLKALSFL